MRKWFKLLMMFILAMNLSSCDSTKKGDLIISEFIENSFNSVLELYNCSDKTIDLKEYKIEIDFITSIKKITLKGSLPSHQTYIIAYDSQYLMDNLREKVDLFTEQLYFSGRHAVSVVKKEKVVDIIGIKGSNATYCSSKGLVRKTKYLKSTTKFDEYEWIRFPVNDYSNLGNVQNKVTEEQLLAGPRLSSEDMQRPFFKEDNHTLGGGGVTMVTVASYGDGDTTVFNFPKEIELTENPIKVRYQNVDTRETMADLTQEWGVPAKNFTNDTLKNAGLIQVQSVLNGSIYETFGRVLGWVWVDGELLNFKLVKEGYSELAFSESDSMYNGILYCDYLYHAELYAKRNKLKLHGEKDPTWNYETNSPK